MDIKGLTNRLRQQLLKKKVVLIITLAFVILCIGGLTLFFTLDNSNGTTKQDKDRAAESILVKRFDHDNIIKLKPFTWIALSENSNMKRIRIGIVLELIAREKKEIVTAQSFEIRALVRNLSAKQSWIELRNPEGKLKFKYLLIEKINSLLPDAPVRNLYLTTFIMR